MSRNKEIDDLEYLAELGYALQPQADSDLPNLRSKIRTAAFSYQHNGYTLFFIALLGVFVGISIFFSIYEVPINILPPTPENGTTKISLPTNDSLMVTLNEVEVLSDNFVKSEIQKPRLKIESRSEAESPATENLASVQLLELPTQTLTEQKLKFIVNSPVIFIHDLKVSNYSLLYFKRNRFVSTTGLSANYSDAQESKLRKEAPEIWLHEQLAEALWHYQKGQYTPCIVTLNEVAEYNTEDVNCDFYRGMSFYQLKSNAKAISFFDKCIEASNNAFLQEATYYKALALKELGRTREAKLILKQIVEEGEFYSEKAADVLKRDF